MRYTLRGRGAAQCARCGVAILRGEHCFEHTCVDSRTRAILHPECAMDVDTVGFARVLESCRELLPNWASFNELAITRTGILCEAPYEIVAHKRIGKNVGVTDEQNEALDNWQAATCFNEVQRAALAFTDEIVRLHKPTDATFNAIAAKLTPAALV